MIALGDAPTNVTRVSWCYLSIALKILLKELNLPSCAEPKVKI